ncbi:MAG: hypothetical protein Q9218_006237 [Villophora microphyllina]
MLEHSICGRSFKTHRGLAVHISRCKAVEEKVYRAFPQKPTKDSQPIDTNAIAHDPRNLLSSVRDGRVNKTPTSVRSRSSTQYSGEAPRERSSVSIASQDSEDAEAADSDIDDEDDTESSSDTSSKFAYKFAYDKINPYTRHDRHVNRVAVDELARAHNVEEGNVFTVRIDHIYYQSGDEDEYEDEEKEDNIVEGRYSHLADANAAALRWLMDKYRYDDFPDWTYYNEHWDEDWRIRIECDPSGEELIKIFIETMTMTRRVPKS